MELEGMSLKALRFRQQLGRAIIRKLRTEWADEEGADSALEKYEGQVKEIAEEIRRRTREAREEAGEETPPAQRIKAKLARLGAKADRR